MGIFSVSTGAGFLPRTVVMIVTVDWSEFMCFDHAKDRPKVARSQSFTWSASTYDWDACSKHLKVLLDALLDFRGST